MRNMTMADFYKADLVDGDMWNDDDEDGDDGDDDDGGDDNHLHLGQPPALVLQQCKDLAPESESAWFFFFFHKYSYPMIFSVEKFLDDACLNDGNGGQWW